MCNAQLFPVDCRRQQIKHQCQVVAKLLASLALHDLRGFHEAYMGAEESGLAKVALFLLATDVA